MSLVKRYLTNNEIDYLLDKITINKSIPEETAISVIDGIKLTLIKQLRKLKVYPQIVDKLKFIIERDFEMCKTVPGDMIGILAALNLGCMYTQSVMNSITGETLILLNNKYTIRIKDFVDTLIGKRKKTENSTIMNLLPFFNILSVSKDGIVTSKNIIQVSRHKISEEILYIKTKSGKEIRGTKSHSFLIKNGNIIVRIEGKLLKLGDKFPVNIGNNVFYDEIVSITEEFYDDYVYDIGVSDNHTFSVFNGIQVSNSFHFTGQTKLSSSNLGRLEELTNLRKDPKEKYCVVYFNKEDIKETEYETIKHLRKKCFKDIEYKTVDDFTQSFYVYYRKDLTNEEVEWYDTFIQIYQIDIGYKSNGKYKLKYDWMVRLEIDIIKLKRCSLSLEDLTEIINNEWLDFYCICSDTNILDIHINPKILESPENIFITNDKYNKKQTDKEEIKPKVTPKIKTKKTKKILIPEELNEIKISFEEDEKSFKEEEEKEEEIIEEIIEVKGYINEDNQNYFYCIKVVQQELLNTPVCGIEGIEKINLEKHKNEWIAVTDGSNFRSLISLESIDWKRTTPSYIWEIYEVLGVEAARQYLITELNNSFNSNSYVHTRYSQLFVDSMTYQGKLSSANRYGISRGQVGPIAKASFEEPLENIVIASLNKEKDNLKGVSSCVILGKEIYGGSNTSELRISMSDIF